jgi:hypothetical protein
VALPFREIPYFALDFIALAGPRACATVEEKSWIMVGGRCADNSNHRIDKSFPPTWLQ